MSEKHYNIDYLENTGQALQNLKLHSYSPLQDAKGLIIDIGCGTGLDVIKMSELLTKATRLVGIDHDKTMLDKAIASAQGNPKTEFILSDSDKIPFQENEAAGIRAERLIQHLKNPEPTLKEIHRVLKTGNPLVIVETDWPSLTFYNENTSIANKVVNYLTEIKVNHGYASRKLTALLNNQHFKDIKIEVFPFVINNLNDANNYIWLTYIVNEAAEKGYINADEKELFMTSLKTADDKQLFICSMNMVIVSCIK